MISIATALKANAYSLMDSMYQSQPIEPTIDTSQPHLFLRVRRRVPTMMHAVRNHLKISRSKEHLRDFEIHLVVYVQVAFWGHLVTSNVPPREVDPS